MPSTSEGAAYDIAKYICDTLSLGTFGTTVFCNTMPASPDNLISTYEYGGAPSSMPMGSVPASAIEHPSVQVEVRNTSSRTARSTAYTIYKALDGLGDVTLQGVTYMHMFALQPPFPLEVDANNRTIFAFNLWISKGRG